MSNPTAQPLFRFLRAALATGVVVCLAGATFVIGCSSGFRASERVEKPPAGASAPHKRTAPARTGGTVASRPAVTRFDPLDLEALGAATDEFDTEQYDHIEEDGYLDAARYPLSTFSVDVDTASYANVRRMVLEGDRPPAGAVRIEEFVNYFSYEYPDPPPGAEEPFSVVTEVMPAPWKPEHQLVMVGVQGRRIEAEDLPPRNLTFLLDVSGSMESPDKLPLVTRAMAALVRQLRPEDHVAIVVYAGASGLVLPPTSGAEQGRILGALSVLSAGGSTNGGDGIQLAYRVAREHFDRRGINRVILASDGDFNVGMSSLSELVDLIERERESGVFLTVLGVGRGNLQDTTMEQLADHGNGNYAYLDDMLEARKVLVTEAGGTLVTIAKDVKIQAEFNPRHVAAYRLIGYENRRLRDEDFNDDRKDAGEVGAGHSVTALYEVIPVGQPVPGSSVDPLRYQQTERAESGHVGELLTVKLRYKHPDGDESHLLTRHVAIDAVDPDEGSRDMRFASAVTMFGLLLRESSFRGESSYEQAIELARGALGPDPHGYRAEFIGLVGRASELSDVDSGGGALSSRR